MFLLALSSTITVSGELMLYFIWSMVHLDCHFPCHLTSFIAQQLLIFLSVFTWLEFQLNKFSTSLQQWWILNTVRILFIIAILSTGLIEENALLVGWEVDVRWQQSVLSHTIKKLHIASQGNMVLAKMDTMTVTFLLEHFIIFHASCHNCLVHLFLKFSSYFYTVYFGLSSHPASSLSKGLNILQMTQLQAPCLLWCCHNAFLYAYLTKGCLKCFSSRKWRLFFHLFLRWRKKLQIPSLAQGCYHFKA